MNDRKQISVRLEADIVRRLKIIALNENTTIQEIISDYLIKYVENHEASLTSSVSSKSNEKDYFDSPFPTTWENDTKKSNDDKEDDDEYHECSNEDWDNIDW